MTDTELSAAEMRGLLQFAQGLTLDDATVREMVPKGKSNRRHCEFLSRIA